MNRRNFLARSGAVGLGAALTQFALSRQTAAQAADYRALVCIHLGGGLDNWDTVFPYDDASYAEYARIRESLLPSYATPRDRSTLLAIEAGDRFGTREFALAPEMADMASLYQSGKLAIVGNVGPLVEPVTRSSYNGGTVRLPSRLFSHNDQASTWQSGGPEGSTSGWGGRFADAVASRNKAPQFGAITTGDNELFLTGSSTVPYQVSVEGAARIEFIHHWEQDMADDRPSWFGTLRQHLHGETGPERGVLERDVVELTRRSAQANALYDAAQQSAPALQTSFPPSDVSMQLQAVTRAISVRSQLSVGRQVFVVGMGGYDTHSAQAQGLPMLQSSLSSAILAFQTAIEELGLEEQVTLFTTSEFGRSLAVNGDGTDHGWGGHQFVIGGAVRGGAVYGDLPEATLGHERDAGGGRLIPSLSVEQYAAPLGRWFGLGSEALASALPGLARLGASEPEFI